MNTQITVTNRQCTEYLINKLINLFFFLLTQLRHRDESQMKLRLVAFCLVTSGLAILNIHKIILCHNNPTGGIRRAEDFNKMLLTVSIYSMPADDELFVFTPLLLSLCQSNVDSPFSRVCFCRPKHFIQLRLRNSLSKIPSVKSRFL